MHAHYRDQVRVALLVVLIQKRPVLVVVGVDVFKRELLVGLDKVVEHFDLQINPFLGQLRLNKLKNFGMGHRRGTDHQLFIGLSAKGGHHGHQSKKLFHCTNSEQSKMSRLSDGCNGTPDGHRSFAALVPTGPARPR